ncbi:hypothetical protein ACJ41O_000224 [Fusarium nematophilum]
MTQLPLAFEPAHAYNSVQFTLPTRRGDYLIQVYVVDGNAYFFTATDVARRLEFINETRSVIVAVGYPIQKCVYDKRRAGDLTPPSSDGKMDLSQVPPGKDGKPQTDLPYGGASDFLDVILTEIMPYVEDRVFPDAPLKTGPKALFGHSYGGLFTLNALFTKPEAFDTFISASPSIWFNNRGIVREQEARFHERDPPAGRAPRLLVMFGGAEQTLIKQPGETDEHFDRRQKKALERGMKDNALGLVERMSKSPQLRGVWQWEFEAEDHGGAAVCGLQRGLMKFLTDKKA